MIFNKKNKRAVKYLNERRVAPFNNRFGKKKHSGRFSRLFSRFLYWLSLFSFLGATVYVFFLSPFLSVSEINLSGIEKLDEKTVRETINPYFSGKYFNLFPKNNIILLSKNRIKSALRERFKNIAEVSVEKKFPEKININIKEVKTVIVFCSADKCFVVDGRGIAYAEADFEANELGENKTFILRDLSNKEIFLGGAALNPEYIGYIFEIKDKFKSEAGIELDKEINTPNISSGDIRMKSSEGWMIYSDRNISAQKEAETLKLVLENKISKEDRGKLDYIDLRTENKVYYKLKNIEPVQPPAEEVKNEETKKDKKK